MNRENLRGTIQNDILKEYIARGTYIFPPGPSMHLITDCFSFCAKQMPLWNPISISGYHIREAGSTAIQVICHNPSKWSRVHRRGGKKKGLDIDQFAPRLSFFFNCHNDFLKKLLNLEPLENCGMISFRRDIGLKIQESETRFHTSRWRIAHRPTTTE